MLIYDNVIFNIQKSGGISVYWKELIDRLQKENRMEIKFLEYKKQNINLFRNQIKINRGNLIKMSAFPSIYIKRYLNLRINRKENIVFHSSYYRIAKGKKIKNVVTVHDFTYEKKMDKLIDKIHIHQKKIALKNADAIICVSESTKNDLLEIYPEMSNKIIKVIYNSYDSGSYKQISNMERKKEVVFVGGRTGYKNFELVVEALKNLDDYILNIVGSPLLNNEEKLLHENLNGRFRMHTHISNVDLNKIYNSVECLIYPSEYEGFGIPILEAMAAGCPVIAMKVSSIPEVAGDSAIFVEKKSSDIINSIKMLKSNSSFRDEIVQKGLKNVKRFSWDKSYTQTIEVYMSLFESDWR